MKKSLLTVALALACFFTHAADKLVVSNNGSGWSNANNYSPAGIPQDGDVVTIPSGLTIAVKGNIYGSSSPSIKLNILGTLDFDPSGKLSLASTSIIQIFALGKITTNGSSSEIISIGGIVKYNGQNDGTLVGPIFAAGGTETSTALKAGSGFLAGVLPIKFVSFESLVHASEVELNWKILGGFDVSTFVIQRKNETNWEDIQTIILQQEQNTYSYKDKAAKKGNNCYRLKMTGKNGEVVYSSILPVNLTQLYSALSIVPNPALSQTVISWKGAIKNGKLILVNSAGAVALEAKTDHSDSFHLNLAGLAKGVYHIVIWDEKQVMAKAFVLHY